MGTFVGHILPGSFFILFAIWGLVFIIRSFYRRMACDLGRTLNQIPAYKSRITYPISPSGCCCSNKGPYPIDSYLKVIFCIVGILNEVDGGLDSDYEFVRLNSYQHSTMYSMFALSGIIELLRFYGLLKVPL